MIEMKESGLVRRLLPGQGFGVVLAILTDKFPVAKSQSHCRGVRLELAGVINLNS